ncbi:MAG: cytochrome P450 [Variovorax sp.]
MPLSELDDEIASHRIFGDEARFRHVFARLRAEDPVHLTKAKGHPPFWAVTKQADVAEVERQNDKFLNAPMVFLQDVEEWAQRLKDTNGTGHYLRTLVSMDGTEHRATRGLTQAWFMPRNVKQLEEAVRVRATEMMDLMLETDRCDFAQKIAPWYPLRVIMSLLGMPEERHRDLLNLTQKMLAPQDDESETNPTARAIAKKEVIGAFVAHFHALIAARKAKPEEDLATLLVNAQIDGKPLGPSELLGYFLAIATAGHDTTASALSGGLVALLQHPDQLERLRREPELMAPAVEEILRWTSPVRHFIRTANEDYVLRGRQIRRGDYLMMCFPSASFDEEVFPDSHLFRIDRTPNRHLAFGSGVHTCLGQHLSRMELKAFMTEFLKRVDKVELDGPVVMVASNQVSGPKHVPLRYEARATA